MGDEADLVYRLLKVGVPPTAVAKALDLEVDMVRGAQSKIHVDDYGTDEIAEAMTHLIWVAYGVALDKVENGTPAEQSRFIQLVLARSIGLAGKSTPETSEKIRSALAEMASDMAPKLTLADSIYDASAP